MPACASSCTATTACAVEGGAQHAPGSEFDWQVGETMVLGRAAGDEPACTLTLARAS